MKPCRYMLPAIAGAVIGLTTINAGAQDASFGCKILLCVASQNPSWQGVSYCVPPVLNLLAIRKVHPGYWPSCPEAGTGKPGYAEYEDCPAGTTPTTINRESGHGSNMRGTPACAKPVQTACSKLYNRDHRVGNSNYQQNAEFQRVGNACTTTEIIPRTRRKDPYYFDIRNKGIGSVARYYFNLRH
ncbi:hypothetical protein [Mesorhizobium sp. SP-1A]|uniref:hypothetical protein n=1 Tax=Mesorhizobium sp. SP-1A TaxID=3077840 RepID=UPI0028F72F97|nr:hypothetical protein [Mesorhizobium sp. SP-1A]